jgi:hypothetical protein
MVAPPVENRIDTTFVSAAEQKGKTPSIVSADRSTRPEECVCFMCYVQNNAQCETLGIGSDDSSVPTGANKRHRSQIERLTSASRSHTSSHTSRKLSVLSSADSTERGDDYASSWSSRCSTRSDSLDSVMTSESNSSEPTSMDSWG